MPIHVSFKSMLNSFGKTYKEGKTVCKKLSDNSKVCISEEAWSIFYAWSKENNKNEVEGLTVGSDAVAVITPKIYASVQNTRKYKKKELSDYTMEELHLEHAKQHADFIEIGDEACKLHFKVAEEFIKRGIPHMDRTNCDIAVALAHKLPDANIEGDELATLKTKLKACNAMMFRLSQGVKFESGSLKSMTLAEQKSILKNFIRKLKRTISNKESKPL